MHVDGSAGTDGVREEHPALRPAAARLHPGRNLHRWRLVDLRPPAHVEEGLRSGAASTSETPVNRTRGTKRPLPEIYTLIRMYILKLARSHNIKSKVISF